MIGLGVKATQIHLGPQGSTLVVDLDGTLLSSDMLHESFWSAFGRDWRTPVMSAVALSSGRASLKRYLATASDVEIKTLPYNTQVISFIETWRREGGQTALVTASDRDFAESIAQHLGIFDEVHGSDQCISKQNGRHPHDQRDDKADHQNKLKMPGL